MLTDAHHGWIKDALGVDPGTYATQPGAAGGDPAPTGAEPGQTAHPPAPDPALPAGAAFAQQNKPAIDALNKANGRVVSAGPALDARNLLNAELQKLAAAVTANDVAAAQAAFAAAKVQAAIVTAAPDPAMLPVVPGAHPEETPWAKGPGETADVSTGDINQGDHMGDCYLLSSLGEIAKIDPGAVKKMVHPNSDGTYTVTFHKHKTGMGLWMGKIFGSEYEDVQITVDGNFAPGTANAAAGQDEVGGKKEVWVQVVEKAYAKFHGGYDKIQGGVASNAMEELTGKEATLTPTGSVALADLYKSMNTQKPVVMDTPPDDPAKPLPYGLHGGHSYMFDSIVAGADGKPMVKLLNPWGRDQPNLIPFDQLGKGIQRVAAGSMP